MVSGFSECYSRDHYRHNAHLWHMELFVKAGLLHELAELAKTDVHARRRLDRFLYEDGRDSELRRRAERGDKTALYLLVRLLWCVCFARGQSRRPPNRRSLTSTRPTPTPSNWRIRTLRSARLEADERVLASRNGA